MEGKLAISGFCDFETIHYLEIEEHVNQHGRLVARGILTEASYYRCQRENGMGQKIQVCDETGAGLFFGRLTEITYGMDTPIREVEIQGITESAAMDRMPQSRAFQDMGMTYGEMLKYWDYEQCRVYIEDHRHRNGKLEKPFIQYEKTDWKGLRKLAERLGTVIWVDPELYPNVIVLGAFDQERKRAYPLEEGQEIAKTIVFARQDQEGRYQIPDRGSYEVWKFVCEKKLKLGGWVSGWGYQMQIFQKRLVFQKGDWEITYMCSKPCHFSLEGQESSGLNGTALEGTVDFVEQESVRVKLDMDVTEGKRRYAFPYLPVSGNIFYSMPEPGTRVCVYFPDHEEGNGYVIHGKRAELSRFPKPEEKEFHTAADKKLCMAPGRIRLAGGGKEGRNELIFADGKGVWLGSHNRIRLCAKEGIRIKAEGDCKTSSGEHIRLEQCRTENFIDMSGDDLIYCARKYVHAAPVREGRKPEATNRERTGESCLQALDYVVGGIRTGTGNLPERMLAGGIPVSIAGEGERNIYAPLGRNLRG